MNNHANTTSQEAAQTPNATTQYTVSPNTAMFLDLLREQDQLHANISDTLEEYHGELKKAEKYFERDFYPALQSLQDKIFEYINDSITQSTGNII